MTFDTNTIVLLVIIGLAAGVLSGFVGVGGGILIVPALVYFMHFTQHQATGTSLAVLLLPAGILAVMNYYRSGNLDWKAALIIGGAFVIGGYFGSKWALTLSAETVKKVFGGVMLLAALKLIFGK
ncbi:MAG TPA: sulfite exporter TauE/SafE family protein [Flavobacteriales bacterium]|nr:sulfite exporter TauE/SafE family protein [Flavobacteriales bacterium]